MLKGISNGNFSALVVFPEGRNQIGVYKGPIRELNGKTALIRPNLCKEYLLAQFDQFGLTHVYGDEKVDLSHGWHGFLKSEFKIICRECNGSGVEVSSEGNYHKCSYCDGKGSFKIYDGL
jgi:hypothetical protein